MGDKRAAVDLDTIDALTAPTTAATWEYTPGIAHKHYVGSTDGDLYIGLQMMHPDDGRSVPAEANARFIAASRTNIPAMSAALREQDDEIAKLEAEVARLKAFELEHTEDCEHYACTDPDQCQSGTEGDVSLCRNVGIPCSCGVIGAIDLVRMARGEAGEKEEG